MTNTWIELDLDALAANIGSLRSSLATGTELIFVVKANAYGHGLKPIARKARDCGVSWFDVAHAYEGEELRSILPDARILVSGVLDPSEAATAIRNRLIPIVVSPRHGESLAAEATRLGGTLECHAMVDTGMGRLGMTWDSAPKALAKLAGIAGIEVNGICSHFASSDSPDRARADEQAKRFAEVLRRCADTGLSYRIRHISNSGGILLDNDWDYDAVRAGIHLYGYAPRSRGARAKSREPVLTSPILQWKTRVAQVRRVPAGFSVSYDGTHVTSRPTTLAVISAGYSDGYPRLLSNRASVLIGGRRCPVAGRVTMNLTVVDAGPDADVREGEEAVLLGQQGQESVWADELARMAETIPYEILTGIRILKTVVKGA